MPLRWALVPLIHDAVVDEQSAVDEWEGWERVGHLEGFSIDENVVAYWRAAELPVKTIVAWAIE